MLRILLGYKTHAKNESPTVLYAGHDGEELESKRAGAKGFARLTRVLGPTELPTKMPVDSAVRDAFKDVDAASAATEADAEEILVGGSKSKRSGKK